LEHLLGFKIGTANYLLILFFSQKTYLRQAGY